MSEINDTKEIPECTFPITLNLIQKYQCLEPSIIDKYKDGTYQQGYFCGGSNSELRLITCKHEIVILSKIQSYVLYWYHTYLLHPQMNITEAMILQNLYWPGIINPVWEEVTNCDTCQRRKQ